MNIQIGIFVLFVACRLVTSECVERLAVIDNDLYAYDADITEDHDYALTDNMDVGNKQTCILNCYLTTKKPQPKNELCNQQQLKDKCKTLHKKCRCFKLEHSGSRVEYCD